MSAGNLNTDVGLSRYLAKASYTHNDKKSLSFEYDSGKDWSKRQERAYQSGEAVPFEYNSQKGSKDNASQTIYLQPDIRHEEEKDVVIPVSGEHTYQKNTLPYQKSALTDEAAGFSSYFVTDTPDLKSAKQTYFVTRGSDDPTDWLKNNISFALHNDYIPQGELAKTAITEMIEKSPEDAPMDIQGHSLGAIANIQAVANLSEKNLAKINSVNLFQAPDARESINKMSAQARKNIETLESQGKINYYVNAFDLVSMLNRNQPGVDEVGQVHYLIPKNISAGFLGSHSLDAFECNPDGTPKLATIKDNPYLFAAGSRVSALLRKELKRISRNKLLVGVDLAVLFFEALSPEFWGEYNNIVAGAQAESEWASKVEKTHNDLKSATGEEKISLRQNLATLVMQQVQGVSGDYMLIQKESQQESEDEVNAFVQDIDKSVRDLIVYLSEGEVDAYLKPYTKSSLWSKKIAAKNTTEMKNFEKKMDSFARKLEVSMFHIGEYDEKASVKFFKNKLDDATYNFEKRKMTDKVSSPSPKY